MSIANREFSIILSTNPQTLSSNTIVSPDSSRVDISLDTPLTFSKNSVITTVEVSEASIWNNSANISAAKNNNTLNYLIGGVAQPGIVIPDGLYSVGSLNSEVVRQIVNDGNPATTLTLSGNFSTNKVVLTLDATVQVDFTTSTVRDILGFNPAIVPAAPSAIVGLTISGDNVARFAQTLDWIIKSNVFRKSIALNNVGNEVIARIPITSSVGSLTNYTPIAPTKLENTSIRGAQINSFYVEINDDSGNPLPQSEPWNIVLTFREQLLVGYDSSVIHNFSNQTHHNIS